MTSCFLTSLHSWLFWTLFWLFFCKIYMIDNQKDFHPQSICSDIILEPTATLLKMPCTSPCAASSLWYCSSLIFFLHHQRYVLVVLLLSLFSCSTVCPFASYDVLISYLILLHPQSNQVQHLLYHLVVLISIQLSTSMNTGKDIFFKLNFNQIIFNSILDFSTNFKRSAHSWLFCLCLQKKYFGNRLI